MLFVRNMGMYTLLFFVFFVIIGLLLDMPLSKMVMKLCKGNEKAAKIIVLSIVGLLAYILVRMIGSPIVDFLDIVFCTEFLRTYN